MKNIKNYMRALPLAIMLSSSMSFIGCSKTYDTRFLKEVIEGVKDTTCFDDALTEEMLQKIKILEETLTLSEKFHNLDFDRINSTTFEVDIEELLKEGTIDDYISTYVSNKDFLTEDSIQKFSYFFTEMEKRVNHSLYDQGYDDLMELSILCAKSKIADTIGTTDLSLFRIPATSELDLDDGELNCEIYYKYNGLEEYILAVDNNSLSVLIRNIYEMQNKEKTLHMEPTEEEKSLYNKERNTFLKNTLESIKQVLEESYVSENYRIKKKTQ